MFRDVSIPLSLRVLIGSGLDTNKEPANPSRAGKNRAPDLATSCPQTHDTLSGLSDADLARQGLSRGLLALRHGDPETP